MVEQRDVDLVRKIVDTFTRAIGCQISMVGQYFPVGSFKIEKYSFRVAMEIATYLKGEDRQGRLIRRTVVRYLVLAQALMFRDVSTAVKKRFPTLQHLVDAGTVYVTFPGNICVE